MTRRKTRKWLVYLSVRWWHFVGVTIYVSWHTSPEASLTSGVSAKMCDPRLMRMGGALARGS